MLTPDSLVLQAGFALLIAAVLAPRLHHVRLLIGGAALAWLGRALWTGDLVSAAWCAALVGLCLVLAGRRLWENSNVRFSPDELAMVRALFDELPTSRARHLIDQGVWLTGKEGTS